jgi:uncharacterized protein YkwD
MERPNRALRAHGPLRSITRLLAVAIVLSAALTVVGPAAHPKPAAAQTTAEYMEGLLVTWINQARASRGVPALHRGMSDLADYRAKTLASTNTLAHPSCLGCLLTKWGYSWTMCGEVIAGTTYPYGYQAAKSMFNAWKGSSGHWTLLMSRSYTRIGLGVAYRSSNHTSFAAGILVR